MYLFTPALSHPTKIPSGLSPPPPWRFSGKVQSSAEYAASTSAFTADVLVAVSVSGVGAGAPSTKTGRKRNSAVCPTKSTILLPVSPGTEITICRLTPVP